jgi:hypothetical protein
MAIVFERAARSFLFRRIDFHLGGDPLDIYFEELLEQPSTGLSVLSNCLDLCFAEIQSILGVQPSNRVFYMFIAVE